MATLLNTIINDTGYLQLPQGTTLQRPTLASQITLAGMPTTLATSYNGQPLTINGGALGGTNAAWSSYSNLPDYLIGIATTTSINNTDGSSWTLPACRAYMLRDPNWNAVDTTGWTLIFGETGKNYGISSNVSVYYRDFAAGSYSFDNNSAMYMFTYPPTGTAGQGKIRWNTDTRQIEFYAPGLTQKAGPIGWQAMTLPFLVRQIITTGFVLGGYKDSVAWANVNKTVASTDTTTSLGDLLSRTFNYKGGACGTRMAYAFGAGNAHATSSNLSTGFNMVTEAGVTIASRSNMANSRGHFNAAFKETLTAWVTGGQDGAGSANVEEFDLISETFTTLVSATAASGSATGVNGESNGASGQGPWAMSHETFGIFYSGEAGTNVQKNFTFATRTFSTRSGTHPGNHYQQKSIQSKYTNCYAGNEGSWNGGYGYRRTNMITNTSTNPTPTITKALANSGEENYTMGQDWQYTLGEYNGAQNNNAAKFTYATETQVTGGATMQPKGTTGTTTIGGRSSAVCAWRA